MVFIAVEGCCPHPILQSEIVGIANAHAALLGRVHKKDAAERPEGLTAQRLFGLLIDQDNFTPGFDEFRRCDEPREPPAHDNDVRIISHYASQNCLVVV